MLVMVSYAKTVLVSSSSAGVMVELGMGSVRVRICAWKMYEVSEEIRIYTRLFH